MDGSHEGRRVVRTFPHMPHLAKGECHARMFQRTPGRPKDGRTGGQYLAALSPGPIAALRRQFMRSRRGGAVDGSKRSGSWRERGCGCKSPRRWLASLVFYCSGTSARRGLHDSLRGVKNRCFFAKICILSAPWSGRMDLVAGNVHLMDEEGVGARALR